MAKIGDVAGDVAREMGHAPTPEKPGKGKPEPQPEPAAPKNRYDAIFTGWTFSAAAPSSKVYGKDDPESDRASKKLASVTVEICGGDTIVPASIKAVQNKDEEEAHLEFLFQASQYGGQCIKATTSSAKEDLEQWKDRVIESFEAWRETNGGTGRTTATRKLKGVSLL